MGAQPVLPGRVTVHRRITRAATAGVVAGAFSVLGGAGVAVAADYEDANHNVCEGIGCFNPNLVANGASDNMAFGDGMMPALTTAADNIAIGTQALVHNQGGDDNIAIGLFALTSNTFGIDNLAFGKFALTSNTSGLNNIALGEDALSANTSGTNNVAAGFGTLSGNSTGGGNVAIGTNSLAHNTSGSGNLAIGQVALLSNTNASNNVAVGSGALQTNTTGVNNLALGDGVLNHSNGNGDAGGGFDALLNNTTGNTNAAFGNSALKLNTAGSNNAAFGANALLNNTGSGNVAIGRGAGTNLTTGSNNVDIANGGVAGESKTIRIGSASQTAAFLAGVSNTSITGPTQSVLVNANGQLGTATASSERLKREVHPLSKRIGRVLSLRPVSYRYKQGSGVLQFGLIAEQVARVFPALVQFGSDREPTGVYYQELPVLLLAQLQREHKRVRSQQRQIKDLSTQVAQLRAMVLHRR